MIDLADFNCCFAIGDLLTPREVGEHLGVSTSTVLRWTREGKLPGFRLPSGQIRYSEDALEEWLASASIPVAD